MIRTSNTTTATQQDRGAVRLAFFGTHVRTRTHERSLRVRTQDATVCRGEFLLTIWLTNNNAELKCSVHSAHARTHARPPRRCDARARAHQLRASGPAHRTHTHTCVGTHTRTHTRPPARSHTSANARARARSRLVHTTSETERTTLLPARSGAQAPPAGRAGHRG